MARKEIFIRIVNPENKLHEKIIKLAKQNKRSKGKQAEFMLEEYIKEHKL